MIHAFIKRSFQDSVSLMLISRKLSESPNVEEISVMMGTPANKSLLEATGFWHPQFSEATPMIFAWPSRRSLPMTASLHRSVKR